jgi:hypothetical protein
MKVTHKRQEKCNTFDGQLAEKATGGKDARQKSPRNDLARGAMPAKPSAVRPPTQPDHMRGVDPYHVIS